MEGDCHHTVCEIEGLLHAIAVVDVNVYVQNAGMIPAQGFKLANEISKYEAAGVYQQKILGPAADT